MTYSTRLTTRLVKEELARERVRRERLAARRCGGSSARAAERRAFRPFKNYKPHAKQLELHTCDARFIVVCAGRRSGKTFALAHEFVRRILNDVKACKTVWKRPKKFGKHVKPALHYWIVAPIHDLTAAALREVMEILSGENSPIIHYNASTSRLWLRGGVLIECKSADNPKRLVSVGLDGLLADEVARMKPGVWRDNLAPTLDDKGGWGLFGTTPLGEDWFFEELWQITDQTTDVSRRVEGWRGFHFTTADNTAVPRLVEAARIAKIMLPRANYLRNYEASFQAFEGKIYEMFLGAAPHVIDVDRSVIQRRIAGVDWGYKNQGALLEIGITSEGEYLVERETVESKIHVTPPPGAADGFDCWASRCVAAARRGVRVFWCDPSEPEHIESIRLAMKLAGLPNVRVLAARNAVSAGLDVVGAMLQPTPTGLTGFLSPALMIDRSCTETRRQLNSYKWQDGKDERPLKEDDHTCDALRYALYSEHMTRPRGLRRLQTLDLFGHTG